MTASSGFVGLALGMIVLLPACGGAPVAGPLIEVGGAVYSDFRVDLPCEEQATETLAPVELSGIGLTFHDDDGNVVGQTTTGPLSWEQLDYGCRFLASYTVTVPVSNSYRVEFDPPEHKDDGAYYDGADRLTSRQIDYDALTEAAHRWDFEAEPSFVVP